MQTNPVCKHSQLYYIHGYQSSPISTKGKLFKEQLDAKAIQYRDCKPEDLIISDCLDRIKKEIEKDENPVLIGSSLGGFLAAKTALENPGIKQIILLNPAIIPPSVDITTVSGMPKRILLEMKDDSLFENKINADIFILFGTEDDVVPSFWVLEFAMSQEATIKFMNDDHSFTKNIDKLPVIINDIIKK